MSLSSLSFIGIYFPMLLICYNLPIKGIKNLILLLFSLGLYALGNFQYLFLLILSICLNCLLVKISFKRKKKIYKTVAIIIDALVLLGFKYVNSFIGLIQSEISIAFPLGLSYFTFKEISYVVDSREDDGSTFIDAALYIANFLTILSGPLNKFKDELCDIKHQRVSDYVKGFERIFAGLFKKIIIADSLKLLVDSCFVSNSLSVLMAWCGGIAYSLQLYFDFAGYSDIAIGFGHLFGYHLCENFNLPYLATSISDFWKRWHMSLTSWFTTYIYIPLGGSRVKSSVRHIFNLFVVWLATGIWHGSKLTFILWAMIYFILQVLEKYTALADKLQKIHLNRFYTLFVVVIEWVIFRSDSLQSALSYLSMMFGLVGNGLFNYSDLLSLSYYKLPLLLAILMSFGTFEWLKKEKYQKLYQILLLLLFVLCLVIMIGRGYSAPLYAGF